MLAASAFQSGFRILYPGIKRNPDARQPYGLFGNLQGPGIWENAKYAMDARDKTCGTTFQKSQRECETRTRGNARATPE